MKTKTIKRIIIFLPVLCVTSLLYGQTINAEKILKDMHNAMGSEYTPNSIHKYGKGHTNFIDQSQRPEGPFAVNYTRFTSITLPEKGCAQFTSIFQIQAGRTASLKYIINNNIAGAVFGNNLRAFRRSMDEELYLSPEYIYTTAIEGKAVYRKDTLISGVPHFLLLFNWNHFPIRLCINKNSLLPATIEITRHYEDDVPFVWGNVKKTYQYSFWQLINKKYRYPFQRDVYINNMHWQSSTLDSLKLDLAVSTDSLSIADSSKQKLETMYKAVNPYSGVIAESTRLNETIHFIIGKSSQLGSYNCGFINTPDGIIVLETPVTSMYSKAVISEINRVYPDKKIIGAISTSDAWPHIGGIREYIARKIPVYASSLNKAIIERVAKARFLSNPDSLQTNPASIQFIPIDKKKVINQKGKSIEIYPIRTEIGERMLMIYFPAYKLLYTSDMIQRTTNLSPMLLQYLSEIDAAIKREKLDVETVFGLHLPPTRYAEILKSLK